MALEMPAKLKPTVCFACGCTYQAPEFTMGYGQLQLPTPTCPRCNAPFRQKIEPGIGNTVGLLVDVFVHHKPRQEISQQIAGWSHTPEDIDAWYESAVSLDIDAQIEWRIERGYTEYAEVVRQAKKAMQDPAALGTLKGIIEGAKQALEEEKESYVATPPTFGAENDISNKEEK